MSAIGSLGAVRSLFEQDFGQDNGYGCSVWPCSVVFGEVLGTYTNRQYTNSIASVPCQDFQAVTI